jgi:hypothetical protein
VTAKFGKTVAVVVGGLLSVGVASACSPAAASKLSCTASLSSTQPAPNTTETLVVSTSAGASVIANVHWSTGARTRTGVANALGLSKLTFGVGSSPVGHAVSVTVTTKKSGSSSGSCTTSFTPKATNPVSTQGDSPQPVSCDDVNFAPSDEALAQGEQYPAPTHAVNMTVSGSATCDQAVALAKLAPLTGPGGSAILGDPTFHCTVSYTQVGAHYVCPGAPGTITLDWNRFPKISCPDVAPSVLEANSDCATAKSVFDAFNVSPSAAPFTIGADTWTCNTTNRFPGASRCYTADKLKAVFFSSAI